jgi:hypothetical protein
MQSVNLQSDEARQVLGAEAWARATFLCWQRTLPALVRCDLPAPQDLNAKRPCIVKLGLLPLNGGGPTQLAERQQRELLLRTKPDERITAATFDAEGIRDFPLRSDDAQRDEIKRQLTLPAEVVQAEQFRKR